MPARPVYDAGTLAPREIAPFTHRQRLNALRNRRNGWGDTDLLPEAFDVNVLTSPTAIAAIRKAFLLAKTSHNEWRSYRREGRFDRRAACRATRGNQDVFRTRSGASTTRVKCAVLVDASGSMQTTDAYIDHPTKVGQTLRVTRHAAAAVFGATIAKALGAVPTIDLEVFQHAAGHGMVIKYRWAKGTPVGVFNDAAGGYIGGGGNADGHALYAITERMLKSIKRDEHGVIMVVSDGLPSVYGQGGNSQAGQALIDAVAHARKNGITVIGVAIDGSDQATYYGEGTVKHTGSWTALGSALAKQIGAALAKGRTR